MSIYTLPGDTQEEGDVLERSEEDGAESHISTFSGGGNCVEVTRRPGGDYVVRDSRDDAPGTVFTCDQWKAFIAGVKDGQFDF